MQYQQLNMAFFIIIKSSLHLLFKIFSKGVGIGALAPQMRLKPHFQVSSVKYLWKIL